MPRARKPKKPIESPRLARTFDPDALSRTRQAYPRTTGLGTWKEATIDAAVEAQIRGCFRQPVLLARSLLKEPSIYAASLNRIAPHRGLKRQISSPTDLTGTAAAILAEARTNFEVATSVALSPGLLADDFDRVAMHEIAVDQVYWEQRADGSRLDPFVEPWPLEFVEWFEIAPDGGPKGLFAFTTDGWVRIVHGDGRWIVHTSYADRPWRRGAIVPLARLWIDMTFGRRDRSANSESHGDDKWWAELPPNIMPEDDNGKIVLEQLAAMYEPRHAAVFPNGTKPNRSEAMSQNWQIFKELLESGLKDAQRILLGQDGTMTNSGGSYVKAWGLFGVRNDIIESDISTVGAGHSTGLLRPWSLINFGRWDRLSLTWLMPDADEDARLESEAERVDAFNRAWKEFRENGALIDDGFLKDLATRYGVKAPKLAPAPPANDIASAPAKSDGPPTVVAHRAPLRAASSG